MSDTSNWPAPPTGVSSIKEDGARQQLGTTSGRTRRAGEDVLKNVSSMRKVNTAGGTNPTGVGAASRDIREGKIPHTRVSRRSHVSFTSVDGKEYTFRTHDTKGKQLPHLHLQVLYMCLHEIILGGAVNPVLEAFNVNFPDAMGVQFFPIPPQSFLAATQEYETPDAEGMIRALGSLGGEVDSEG